MCCRSWALVWRSISAQVSLDDTALLMRFWAGHTLHCTLYTLQSKHERVWPAWSPFFHSPPLFSRPHGASLAQIQIQKQSAGLIATLLVRTLRIAARLSAAQLSPLIRSSREIDSRASAQLGAGCHWSAPVAWSPLVCRPAGPRIAARKPDH